MNQPIQTLQQQLKLHEKNIITSTMSQYQKLYQVADALGIQYCTLWRKMKQHGISCHG